jgi:hypothetical protein
VTWAVVDRVPGDRHVAMEIRRRAPDDVAVWRRDDMSSIPSSRGNQRGDGPFRGATTALWCAGLRFMRYEKPLLHKTTEIRLSKGAVD